jgi:hypothetical protein
MVVHKVDDVCNAVGFALDGDMRKEFRTALRTPMHPIGPETSCTCAEHLSHGHFPTTSQSPRGYLYSNGIVGMRESHK